MEHRLEALHLMTDQQQSTFARAIQVLLSSTFIIRQIDKDKELYRFVMSNYRIVEAYLSYAELHLRKDEHLGIIACGGPSAVSTSLNLEETLSLLIFRLLYEEKQHVISLQQEHTVRQCEFHEKYKILTDRMLGKTRMREVLHTLKALKLILVRGDELDPETLIVLYPSLAFVVDSQVIDDVYDRIARLSGKQPEAGASRSATGEPDEPTDDDAEDIRFDEDEGDYDR
jgi:hypothetical protein